MTRRRALAPNAARPLILGVLALLVTGLLLLGMLPLRWMAASLG